MQTLLALVVTALACALARPSAPTDGKAHLVPMMHEMPPLHPPREYYTKYILPQMLLANYYAYEDSPRIEMQSNQNIFDKEINMINRMKLHERRPNMFEAAIPYWAPSLSQLPVLERMDANSQVLNFIDSKSDNTKDIESNPNNEVEGKHVTEINLVKMKTLPLPVVNVAQKKKNVPKDEKIKSTFALTPYDAGYFDPKYDEKDDNRDKAMYTASSFIAAQAHDHYAPRQIRQRPNSSKAKTLVAGNLDLLRVGLSQDNIDGTEKPHLIHVLETPTADPDESLFVVALLAAVGAALAMALIAFAIGWYTLSKKSKAAADVDYPAYGVTGPTVDSSGDRKLAQSAHMYHYQHQKQQIIAMERSGLDQRNGSVSDPESEEENEEGDYTVYECPGFATTGDMEVKNPLFKDEPTPATPGNSEAAKPVHKE